MEYTFKWGLVASKASHVIRRLKLSIPPRTSRWVEVESVANGQ